MYSVSRPFLIAAVVLLVAACASRSAVESFTLYKTAFDEAKAVSDSVFDELAVSERKLARRVLKRKLGGLDLGTFDPDLSIYYATQGDPPFTAAYKNAFAVVDAYNTVLVAMATGEGFVELRQKSDALLSQLTGLSSLLGAASPAGPLGGIGLEVVTKNLLNPIRDHVIATRSRVVFRESFIETFPLVEALIEKMREGTGKVYQVLTVEVQRDISNPVERRKRLEAYRATISNWVVMLDTSLEALRAARNAVDSDPELFGTVTEVAAVASELLKNTSEVRTQLAKLRAARSGE